MDPIDVQRIHFATKWAARAHAGQLRKYSGAPYVLHLWSVFLLVRAYRGSIEQQIAALLHDTIEDCGATRAMIQDDFGSKVAELVVALTDVYTSEAYPKWNRKKRKAAETERKIQMSDEACLIKLADIYDNMCSFEMEDPDMAKTVAREIGPFVVDCWERRNLGLAGNTLRGMVLEKVGKFR